MSSFKQKTFNNVLFNTIAKIVAFIFQAIANIILSRNLLSSDYGIVGFANIFVSFLNQFSDLGLNSAVVHRKTLDEKALYTGFTVKLGIALGVYSIAFIASSLAIYIFNDSSVVAVIKILSFNFIFNCFAFLPTTLLKRDLDYKKITIATIGQTLTTSIISIALALSGYKYWSIVIANIAGSLMMVIIINALKPTVIKFKYDSKISRELLGYGTSLSATFFLVFILFNIDNFIIGAVLGATSLGYYMIAFNWGTMICNILTTIVGSVLFPTFTKISDNKTRLKNAYLNVLEFVTFLGVLVNTTLIICSKDFLVVILGHGTDKWLPALASLNILLCYGIIRLILEPIGSVIMSLGLNKALFKANAIAAIVQITLLYPALKYGGITGASIVVTISYLSQYLIFYPVINEVINVNIAELIDRVKYPLITSISITIIMYAFQGTRYYTYETNVITFIVKAVIVIVLYVVSNGMITNWKVLRESFKMISSANAQ